MPKASKSQKSPMVLLLSIAILVIATLVVATTFFLQPSIELELKKKLTQHLSYVGLTNTVVKVSGRDVTLAGIVNNQSELLIAEKTAKSVWGIRKIDNQLMIINRATD